MATEYLIPNAQGTWSQWNALGGGDQYLEVDEAVGAPDDDSSYIWCLANQAYKNSSHLSARVNILDNATINSVKVVWRIRNTISTANDVTPFIILSGSITNASHGLTPDTSYTSNTTEALARPGGGAWSPDDLDDLECGIEQTTTTRSIAHVQCTQYYVVVDYTAYVLPPITPPVATFGLTAQRGLVLETDWPDLSYLFRRELTFGTGHSGYTTDDTVEFEFETGLREIIATNGCFNEAIQESGYCHEHRTGKTHVVFLSKLGTDLKLGIYVTTKNHATGEWTTPVKIDDAKTDFDTHHFPVMCIDNNDIIHVFYGCHNSPMYYARSNNANDSSSWDLVGTIGSLADTYPIAFCVPSDNRLYVISRTAADKKLVLYYSTNGGDNWSAAQTIVHHNAGDAYRVYGFGCRLDSNERLHLGFSYIKTGNLTEGAYYIYSDYTGVDQGFVTWKDIEDATVGTVEADPVHQSDGAAVIENASGDQWMYFCRHLLLDSTNSPILLCSEYDYYEGPNSEMGIVAARWTGAAWSYVRFHEEFDLKHRVGRCGVPGLLDRDDIIHCYMPIAGKFHLHHKPTSDAYYTSAQTSTSGASLYEMVDDGHYKYDGNDTYLYTTGSASADASFLSTATISDDYTLFGVGVEAAVRDTVGDAELTLFLRINGTDYDYDSGGVTGSALLYHRVAHIWHTNPATSQAWTKAEAEAVEFGFKETAGGTEMRVTNCTKMLYVGIESDNEYGSSEIVEVMSNDDGATWDFKHLTANSAVGVPIVNVCHRLVNETIEVVWTSGADIFLYQQSNFGKVRRDARDLRVFHGFTEIDRIIDYADYQNTKIRFRLPEAISAGEERGTVRLWLVYGSPDVSDQPMSDPNAVHHWGYDGFEEFDDNDNINGSQGWSVTAGTVLAYQSPPSHSNKVALGSFAAESSAAATAEKEQASARADIYVEAYLWVEISGDIYLALVDAGGDYIAVGLNDTLNFGKYYNGGSWTNSTEKLDNQNMFKVAIALEAGVAMSAWVNDVKIADSVSIASAMGSVEKVRIVTPSHSFFDNIAVRKRLLTDVVTLGTEEIHGVYVGATISGQEQDQVEVDAYIEGTAEPSGWASVGLTVQAPTVIYGSLTLTVTASCGLTAVAPTIVQSSITASVASADFGLTSTVPTVVLPPVNISPALSGFGMAATAPTVVYGSISLSPAYADFGLTAGAPTVVHSSISTQPAAASLRLTGVAASIVQDSIAASPAYSAFGLTSIAPTIIYGSISLTAAAHVGLTSIAPVIVLSSVSASPALAACGLTATAPTVVHGSLTLTATGSFGLTATAPTIVASAITAAPAAARFGLDSIIASVGLSSMSVAPAHADFGLSAIAPTVALGAVTVSAPHADFGLTATSPTVVASSATASPATARFGITATAPTTVYGSISLTPAASKFGLTVTAPAVVIGAVAISPSAASFGLDSVTPGVIHGSLTLLPAVGSLGLTAIEPTIAMNSVTASPALASLGITAVAPSVIYGSVIVPPAAAMSAFDVVDPTVVLSSISAAPASAECGLTSTISAVVHGSLALTPAAARLGLGAQAPSVLVGAVAITPAAASLGLISIAPTIVYSSVSVIPVSAHLGVSALAPAVVLSSMTVSASNAALGLTTASPVVQLGNIAVVASPAAFAVTGHAPSIVQSSVTTTGTAGVALSSQVGVVTLSSLAVQPGAASFGLTCQSPTVDITEPIITPAAARLGLTSAIGSVIGGSISLSPAHAGLGLTAASPTVTTTSLSVAPAYADYGITAGSPDVTLGSITLADIMAEFALTAFAPTTILGSVAVGPNAAMFALDGVGPVLILSSVTVTAAGAQIGLTAIAPTVTIEAAVITSTPASIGFSAQIGDVIHGSITYSPALCSFAITSIAPTTTITGISDLHADRKIIIGVDDRIFLPEFEHRLIVVPQADQGLTQTTEDRLVKVRTDDRLVDARGQQ